MRKLIAHNVIIHLIATIGTFMVCIIVVFLSLSCARHTMATMASDNIHLHLVQILNLCIMVVNTRMQYSYIMYIIEYKFLESMNENQTGHVCT